MNDRDVSTDKHGWLPDMTPALNMEPGLLIALAEKVAEVALAHGHAVAVLGANEEVAAVCLQECACQHVGSVVVVPDLLVLQLEANEVGPSVPTAYLSMPEGRSVALFAVRNE